MGGGEQPAVLGHCVQSFFSHFLSFLLSFSSSLLPGYPSIAFLPPFLSVLLSFLFISLYIYIYISSLFIIHVVCTYRDDKKYT